MRREFIRTCNVRARLRGWGWRDTRHGSRGLALLASLALGGCDAKLSGNAGETISLRTSALTAKTNTIYRKQAPGVAAAAPAGGGLLNYFGGRVVSNIQVVEVIYGAGGTGAYIPEITGSMTPNVPSFYQGVLNSPYVDWLVEYDTTAPLPTPRTDQVIGRGSFSQRITIVPSAANNGATIDDANIRAELSAQIAAGKLPAPTHDAAGNNNTYYAVYVPHGKVVTAGGLTSCVDFCAYHGNIAGAGGQSTIYYGVHPDLQVGSGCETGCSVAPTTFGRYTQVASHELVETMTDPEPGSGWLDPNNGQEIGDICLGTEGTVVGSDGITYNVQSEWSNLSFFCIVQKDGSGGTGGMGGAGMGGAGAGGVGGVSGGAGGVGGMSGAGAGGMSGAGAGGMGGAGAGGASGGVGGGGMGAGGAGSGGRANSGGAAGLSGAAGQAGAGGRGGNAGGGGKAGASGSAGSAGTSAGTGGTGGGGPCAGLCANPTSFTINGSFQSGSLGTGNVCRQTSSPIHGGNCGNFVSPRQLSVNGATEVCNGGNWASVPPARNGGYCIQATSGNQPWAFFTTW
jgi:hypothetical protein